MPKKIAIPPNRTIFFLCCFLSSGLSNNLNLKANELTIGTLIKVHKKALINTIEITI